MGGVDAMVGQVSTGPTDRGEHGADLLLDADVGREGVPDRHRRPTVERQRVIEIARLALGIAAGPTAAVHVHHDRKLAAIIIRPDQVEGQVLPPDDVAQFANPRGCGHGDADEARPAAGSVNRAGNHPPQLQDRRVPTGR